MPCMHIAFSHCFRWHFLFADKRAYPSEQRTDYPNGFHTHLDRKHDGPDFLHRLPGSRLSLCNKHRGHMHKLGIALVLVFIAWLLCSNLLPAAVFYLAGNTRQAAFTCANIISMITTTSAYIYAYYMMYRAIKTIGCFVQ